jgi:exo-beta-1,3-glucanase (GH17 family)
MHQHQKKDVNTCDCTAQTVTTWVPYIPSEWTTSTVTVWTTQSVIIQQSGGSTVTMTVSGDASPTLVSQRAKRQIDAGGPAPYGMTYTPYDSTGACMSAEEVLPDLQNIQSMGFPRIRMYGVDCDQLSTVADQATSLGLKITVGVYIDDTGLTRGNADLAAVLAWGNWANVDIITIGTILRFKNP